MQINAEKNIAYSIVELNISIYSTQLNFALKFFTNFLNIKYFIILKMWCFIALTCAINSSNFYFTTT